MSVECLANCCQGKVLTNMPPLRTACWSKSRASGKNMGAQACLALSVTCKHAR